MEQFQRGGGGGRRTRTRHRHRLRRRPRHGTLRQLLGQMFRNAERRTSLGSFAGSRGSALIGHRSQQERPAVCTPPHFTGFRHPPERRDLLLTGRQQRLHAQYLSGSRPQPERPGRSDDPQTFRPRHADRRRESLRRKDLHLAQQQCLGRRQRRIRQQLVVLARGVCTRNERSRRLCRRYLLSEQGTAVRSTGGRRFRCTPIAGGFA